MTMALRLRHLTEEKTGQVCDYPGEGLRFGRKSGECECAFPRSSVVSRVHAEIRPSGAQYVLRDMGSANGTFLNHVRVVDAAPIAPGDQIMLGLGGPTFEIIDLPPPPIEDIDEYHEARAPDVEKLPHPTHVGARPAPLPVPDLLVPSEARTNAATPPPPVPPRYEIPASDEAPPTASIPPRILIGLALTMGALVLLGVAARSRNEPPPPPPQPPSEPHPALAPEPAPRIHLPPLPADSARGSKGAGYEGSHHHDQSRKARSIAQIRQLARVYAENLRTLQVFLLGEHRRQALAPAVPVGSRVLTSKAVVDGSFPAWSFLMERSTSRLERYVVKGARFILTAEGIDDRASAVEVSIDTAARDASGPLAVVPLKESVPSLPLASAKPGDFVALLDYRGVLLEPQKERRVVSVSETLTVMPPLRVSGPPERWVGAPLINKDGIVGFVTRVSVGPHNDRVADGIVSAIPTLEALGVR